MAHSDWSTVRNRLLQAMTADDFARIQPHLEPVDLASHQILIARDTPIEHLHFMESGMTSITADGTNGQVEVGIIGREGLVGASPVLLGGDRIPYDHFIQIPGSAWRIRVEAVHAAMADSASLYTLLLRYIQTELIQARQTAFVNATLNIEARLARWLLMCHDRVDGEELPLKHEFLSMMLGVRRAGVTLALQQLEGAGCIRGRRGRVTVLARALLEEVAEGGYGIPEAEYTRLIAAA